MSQIFDTLPFPAPGGMAGRGQRYGLERELEPERGGRPAHRSHHRSHHRRPYQPHYWPHYWAYGWPYPGHGYSAGPYGDTFDIYDDGDDGTPSDELFLIPQAAGGDRARFTRSKENIMHQPYCNCPQCRARGAAAFDVMPFRAAVARPGLPFSAAREQELAMELLSVSSEAEMEQFLGSVFSSVWKGVKKVAAPLGGVLKAVAKQALPYVGGALGSLIPIPGVGTALGRAVGSAVSQALEMEFEGLAAQQQEFESARRFVRLAGTAAQLAGQGDGSPRAVRAAVLVAARRHIPALARPAMAGGTAAQGGTCRDFGAMPMPGGATGRWRRRGNRIVLSGDF